MVYKVNKWQPSGNKLPHTLSWGGWNQLKSLYNGYYAQSSLYSVTVVLAFCSLAVSISVAMVLWWQYFHAK